MLDVVRTSFYIKAPAFAKEDFEHYSTMLFDEWDAYIEKYLNLPDYSVTLVIEEGSIKGLGKIAATAGAIYIAIGNYGGFVSGVQAIQEQASYVTSALFDKAKQNFGCRDARGNSKQSGGEIYYLRKLLEQVQHGKITPDEAIHSIQNRWGKESEKIPTFLDELTVELNKIPRYPEQLSMPDEFWEMCEEVEIPISHPKPTPKLPRELDLPIPLHYRIEISRPRKGGNKKIKLIKTK